MPNDFPTITAPPTFSKRDGCIWRAIVIGLALLACGSLTCGLCLLAYIIFPPDPVNVVVMGLDAREGEGVMTRTDSILFVGFKPHGFNASILSIPRDLFLTAPGYGLQRVNVINVLGETEYSGGGPDLLKASIAQNFDVPATNYVRMDFAAFEALIDAVGGVTVDVDRRVEDHFYPTEDSGVQTVIFELGRQHMDGETALKYARTRQSDDDYFRAGRQQQVLAAFTRRLLNPLHLPAVLSALVRHVETDLSPLDLLTITPVLLANAGGFDRLVIDRDYLMPLAEGSGPDYQKLAPWINERYR
jgi:LCP family protein required for cell wall assembly